MASRSSLVCLEATGMEEEEENQDKFTGLYFPGAQFPPSLVISRAMFSRVSPGKPCGRIFDE